MRAWGRLLVVLEQSVLELKTDLKRLKTWIFRSVFTREMSSASQRMQISSKNGNVHRPLGRQLIMHQPLGRVLFHSKRSCPGMGSVLAYRFKRAATKVQTIHNSKPMTPKQLNKEQWWFPWEPGTPGQNPGMNVVTLERAFCPWFSRVFPKYSHN